MKCPTCPDSTLAITDRQGIEIDYCPKCRGVWLDRGELDKLIERAEVPPAPSAPRRDERESAQSWPMKPDDSHYGYQYGHKKKSFWREIFD
jgi:hypothetical protein